MMFLLRRVRSFSVWDARRHRESVDVVRCWDRSSSGVHDELTKSCLMSELQHRSTVSSQRPAVHLITDNHDTFNTAWITCNHDLTGLVWFNNVREREFWLSILVSNAFSTPAFWCHDSTPAISTPALWCRDFHSRVFHPFIFDAPAFSTSAFSVASFICLTATFYDAANHGYESAASVCVTAASLTLASLDAVTDGVTLSFLRHRPQNW